MARNARFALAASGLLLVLAEWLQVLRTWAELDGDLPDRDGPQTAIIFLVALLPPAVVGVSWLLGRWLKLGPP